MQKWNILYFILQVHKLPLQVCSQKYSSSVSIWCNLLSSELTQVMKNMGEILKASGASYASVVKTTIMYEHILYMELLFCSKYCDLEEWFCSCTCRLADLQDFKKVNEIYGKCKFWVTVTLPSAIPLFNRWVVRVPELKLPNSSIRVLDVVYS